MDGPTTRLESAARERLSDVVYRYFSEGAGDEVSASEAVQAWRRHRFRPHVLRDVTEVSSASSMLGTRLRSPVAVAPTSQQRLAHPGGEAEMARGAAAAGSLLCVSSNAGMTFTEIAAAGGPSLAWWVQAYLRENRRNTADMLERAVAAGSSAVVLTVDTPVVAARHGGMVSAWDLTPPDQVHANEDVGDARHRDVRKARDVLPSDIRRITEQTGLPVVVKGVLRADDATVAADAGASAVWVSNHGGRQLDRSVSTADALEQVVAAVGATVEVYVDGGVRDGRDVVVALALGADGVFLGRPPLWALTVDGSAGVTALIEGIVAELEEAMTLCGARTLAEVTTDLLAQPAPGP